MKFREFHWQFNSDERSNGESIREEENYYNRRVIQRLLIVSTNRRVIQAPPSFQQRFARNFANSAEGFYAEFVMVLCHYH